MREPSLGSVDLNLLLVFDAIMTERSVSRAAERLNLTQSALSHALARLRFMLTDRLFIRTARGMEPTARAEALSGHIRRLLETAREILTPEAVFDPSIARNRFSLGMTDVVGLRILPGLAMRLRDMAPHVHISSVAANARHCVSMIEQSAIDIYIGNPPPAAPSQIASALLYSEESLCVARADHPLFEETVTLARLLAYPHLHLSPSGPGGFVDQALKQAGVTRKITMTLADFLVAPAILEQSDLIAIMPRHLTASLLRRYAVKAVACPFDVGVSAVAQTWHRRFDADPGHSWLREQIRCVGQTGTGH